ncbi:putative ubiquitin-conjugating enzyme E2, ubiquitin-conjugating enzyme/RWD [Helianthus annuus]|nr:putative ubiquitin-conjugating enzyme E2, ubiquitin-conjugating enzyme/RWD [Helianthus annuus]
MKSYSRVGIYPIKDVLPDDAKACSIAMPEDEYVLERYKNFKRIDIVVDHSDHLFSSSPMEQTTEAWAERMREEWRILEESLPETIFVRAYESRMDLLRAAIIGAKGTPYQDGLFFFDVYFPPAYPVQPPLVRYHSGGLAINPHLFECGEVRLNLFRSYNYKSWTLWPSSDTNMLSFLVSIQEQVLNAHPLFHQPGFVDSSPSVVAEYFSLLYNEAIQLKSFETMTHIIKNPPKNFEVFVLGYFRDRAVDILRATNAYREGLQVPDGVDNRESFKIRDDVDSSMICLFVAFVQIRATGVLNFTPIGPFVGFGSFLERSIESASTSPSQC